MDKYRHGGTKAVVEAIQMTEDTARDIEHMVPGAVPVKEIDRFTREEMRAFNIPTAGGMMRLSEGMYLVKYAGGTNNFMVMMPGQFRTHYFPMEVLPGLVSEEVRDSKIMRSKTEQDET
jgi:hypothetical protein